MILNKEVCLMLILTTLGVQFMYAQKPTVQEQQADSLDEVLITATRTKRQLSSLPIPAQIITKESITKSGALRLSDILSEQTGLLTVPDFGGGEGIQMQGLDAQYVLILIDGVPLVGRSAGTLDLNRISVGNIKQIEVVKGASSSLYGSDALGGVINIITEHPQKPFQANLNYRGGSLNSHDLSLNTGIKKERLSLSVFGNRYSAKGYDLDASTPLQTVEPFTNYTAQVKGRYDFSKATSLMLSNRLYIQNQDYRASDILSGESTVNEWNGHLLITQEFNTKLSSTFEFYATTYRTEAFLNDLDGVQEEYSYYDQTLLRPELRSVYTLNSKHQFIAGLGYTYETLARTDFNSDPVFKAPYLYFQYDIKLFPNLNIIAGARYDMHNVYRSQLSPKLAARYKVDNNLAFKASVGSGFKAPAFRQLYFDFTNATVGYTVLGYEAVATAIPELQERGELANIIVPITKFDESLKPESALNLNLGVDLKISKRLTTNLNLFRNSLNNLIDTRIIATKTNGQSVFSYFNVQKSYTQGLEFNFTYRPFNNLNVSGGYQLLYAKDKEAVAAFENGTVYARASPSSSAFVLDPNAYFGLYNRSRHSANFKVFYSLPHYKADVNMRATYRSKYGLSDTNGNGYLDHYDSFVSGYAILDLALNKSLSKNITFGAGIDNLLDFTDPANVSNIPGRLYFAKLILKL